MPSTRIATTGTVRCGCSIWAAAPGPGRCGRCAAGLTPTSPWPIGLPSLTARLDRHASRGPATDAVNNAVSAWDAWWTDAQSDPESGPLFAQRSQLFGDQPCAEWAPPVSWHAETLRAAGYAEVGQLWRHGAHAAVAAIRPQTDITASSARNSAA